MEEDNRTLRCGFFSVQKSRGLGSTEASDHVRRERVAARTRLLGVPVIAFACL